MACSRKRPSTLVKFPRRTAQPARHKEKFYYRGTCWSRSNVVSSRPTRLPLLPFKRCRWALLRPLSNGLDPFKWSQCNRTISTSAQAFHSGHRGEEEITAVQATCWSRSWQMPSSVATIPHRRRITLKSRFHRCCLRVAGCIKWMQKTVPPPLLAQPLSRRVWPDSGLPPYRLPNW